MYKKLVIISSATLTLERPPAAIGILAGIAEHNQIDYEVFDLNLFLFDYLGREKWELISSLFATHNKLICDDTVLLTEINFAISLAVTKILSFMPDLVAVTSFSSMQIPWTDRLLEILREQSNVVVIAGGPGISHEQLIGKTAGRLLADNNLLDYYVLGEGDRVFDNFLRGNIDLGVNHKDSKYENWVPQIENLDNLILPTFKKVQISKYKSDLNHQAAEITITGSRGCVRRCTFCDVGHVWKKFRFRSAQSIVDEIVQHYNEVGCLHYFFSDSLINGSLKQFVDVMTRLIELQTIYPDFKKLGYSGQFIIRPSNQHPEYIYELLSQSGCDNLQVGIESGSERVRIHMGKKFSNDDIDYHLEMCEKYKIKNHILIFTSYPTETIEDHQETIDFYIRSQKYLINGTIIGTNLNSPMVIYKNTPIDNMRNDLGIHIQNMEYANSSNWLVDSNPDLTVKERWRRYAELVQLTTKLRYPRASMDLILIELNIAELIKNITNGDKK